MAKRKPFDVLLKVFLRLHVRHLKNFRWHMDNGTRVFAGNTAGQYLILPAGAG